MKRLITILLFLILWSSMTFSQEYYYYNGEKVHLQKSTDKILVKFQEKTPFEKKRAAIRLTSKLKPVTREQIKPPGNLAIVNVVKGTNETDLQQIIQKIHKNKNIICANPFFVYKKDSTLQGITDRFIVKLKTPGDYSELQKIAKKTNTEIIEQNEFAPGKYILRADKNSNGNALEMANHFHETGKFEYAEPDFYKVLDKHCVNDPHFDDQWALKNTGQHGGNSGADIKACKAWNITTGREVISIAVLDEGVDLDHPDLQDNLIQGFDATDSSQAGDPKGDDAHGTQCAGIIGAEGNNNLGVIGVAHTSNIIPVRIAYSDSSGDDWITTNSWLSDGINWSWQNGADVLSNSWGGGSPSNQVTNAINNAVSNGRDGLGSPVLFSSGNDVTGDGDSENNGDPVNYPANLDDVIAVGAMSMCNERKSPSSCDGENWGSNFGDELDVVAPGVEIPTTDIIDSLGATTTDYDTSFKGTSSACPHAAGVMGLILSINRCLSQEEAREILELSCDKVGAYCYTLTQGHPNGTWNNQMGYGRINAFKAVKYAFSLQTNSVTVGGFTYDTTDNFKWILASGGCSQLAAATYIVKRYEIRANVTYPFTQSPIVVGTSNGFSGANPNSGNFWMGTVQVTNTNTIVRTFVYEVISTISGKSLSWVPTKPSNVTFDFTVLSTLPLNEYLQHDTVSSGTRVHNAMNRIETGRNVTNAVPQGEYVVEGDANVTLHGGNEVVLKPGTVIRPDSGGRFKAFVDPFFTCTQYPMGKKGSGNSSFPSVIETHDTEKLEDTSETKKQYKTSLKVFPNPFTEQTTIKYKIPSSKTVNVTIRDNCGRPVYKLQNKEEQKAGTYEINLSGIHLAPGTYYCTLRTNRVSKTKKVVKIE